MKKAGSVLEKISNQATAFNRYMFEMERRSINIDNLTVYYFQQSKIDPEEDRKQKDRITLYLNYYNNSSSIEFKELQDVQNAFSDFTLLETSNKTSYHEIRLIKEIDKANRK